MDSLSTCLHISFFFWRIKKHSASGCNNQRKLKWLRYTDFIIRISYCLLFSFLLIVFFGCYCWKAVAFIKTFTAVIDVIISIASVIGFWNNLRIFYFHKTEFDLFWTHDSFQGCFNEMIENFEFFSSFWSAWLASTVLFWLRG